MTTPVTNDQSRAQTFGSERISLALTGGLLLGGFLLYIVATLVHPGGNEANNRASFTKYAESNAWVTIHLAQFVGVLVALGGLLLLYRTLQVRSEVPRLSRFAAGATIATAATWAVLQAVDGVGLKRAVDAWTHASGTEKAIRLADAETVRWIEWGLRSYYGVLLGLTFVLFGAAIVTTRVVAGWLGWLAILTGLLTAAIGLDIGYEGLGSGFQNVGGGLFLLAILVFGVGMFVTGVRRPNPLRAA